MQRVRHRTLIGIFILCLSVFVAAPAFAQDQTYVVQPGENLFRIALNFGVDVSVLAQANGITNTAQIYAGQTLVIPTGNYLPPLPQAPPAAAPVSNLTPLENPTYYTVQPGEHLVNIAEKYGLTADQLIQINNIANPNLIFSGQQLIVSLNSPVAAPVVTAPVAAAPAASGQTYTVQPGDHLASIASQFNVSWPDIAQANGLADANIVYVGQTLIIPAPGSSNINDYGIVTTSSLPAAPPAVVPVGKSIVVDLSDQRAYAYEDGRLVHNVLGSTGLPGSPTVVGDFNIYVKYVSTLMVGPGYYLPDVPYTMYFYEGYGLHGTYWHHNWGHPMSHGCVNLPTDEAEWFFNWAPVGTPVHVQY